MPLTPPCFCLMTRMSRISCQASALHRLHFVYMSHGPRQNVGSSPSLTAISVNGNLVEPVDTFVYLGSLWSSDGYCWPDMKRRIGLTTSVMSLLHLIWNDKCLSVPTKIYLFQALVLSILLCFRDLDSPRHWYEVTRFLLFEMSLADHQGSLASAHN